MRKTALEAKFAEALQKTR
jgi:predicted XRE-type DNA-binding protein